MPVADKDIHSNPKLVVDTINGLHSRFPYRPRNRPADWQPLLVDFRYSGGLRSLTDTGAVLPEAGQLMIAWLFTTNNQASGFIYANAGLRFFSVDGFRNLSPAPAIGGRLSLPPEDNRVRIPPWIGDRVGVRFPYPILGRTADNHIWATIANFNYRPDPGNLYISLTILHH